MAASRPGDRLFSQPCLFATAAATVESLPAPTLPEVAFAGRSNVGKSSLVNALTGRQTLARVSHTPGRTQQLNFFDLGNRLRLVDMPGYGFARVGKQLVADWQQLIRDYLRGRAVLRRVLVLIDSRHGIKDSDRVIFNLLDEAAVATQAVLTKTDQLRPEELEAVTTAVRGILKKHPAALPEPAAVSSHRGDGISDLRDTLAALAAANP